MFSLDMSIEEFLALPVKIRRLNLVLTCDMSRRVLNSGDRSRRLPNHQMTLAKDYAFLLSVYETNPELFYTKDELTPYWVKKVAS